MNARCNRARWGASLALHGLALGGMLALAGPEPSPPLRWEVAMAVAVPETVAPDKRPAVAQPAPAAALAAAPKPPPTAPEPAPLPETQASPQPLPAPVQASALPLAQGETPAGAAPAIAAAAAAVPAAAEKPASAATPAPPDVEARRRWQSLLAATLAEFKRYPMLARRLGQEGVVVLEARFQADGRAAVSIKRSSGHAALDRAALKLFEEAMAALAGKLDPQYDSLLDIPVAFRLES